MEKIALVVAGVVQEEEGCAARVGEGLESVGEGMGRGGHDRSPSRVIPAEPKARAGTAWAFKPFPTSA
jgi:hypothetical protein